MTGYNYLDAETDKIAKAICREQCAYHGEPPCWTVDGAEWPNPHCNDPGCVALAIAAKAAMEQK